MWAGDGFSARATGTVQNTSTVQNIAVQCRGKDFSSFFDLTTGRYSLRSRKSEI